MNAQQANNLMVLIRHMEANVTRTLDMSLYERCGSPACALGEAEAIGLIESAEREHVYGEVFGKPYPRNIFSIECANPWKRNDVTPQEWALEARKLLADHGYSMDSDPGYTRFMNKLQEPVPVRAFNERFVNAGFSADRTDDYERKGR